jgi:hypothetical protein
MTVTVVDAARPVTGGQSARLDFNAAPCLVTGGVETHLDFNVAARAAAWKDADTGITATETALRIPGRRVLALDEEKAGIRCKGLWQRLMLAHYRAGHPADALQVY